MSPRLEACAQCAVTAWVGLRWHAGLVTGVSPDVHRAVTAGLSEPVEALGAFGVSSPLQMGGVVGAAATLVSLILRRRRLRLTGTGYMVVTKTQVLLCDVHFAPTRLHRVAQTWARDEVVAVASGPFELRLSIDGQTVELAALNYDDAAPGSDPALDPRVCRRERVGAVVAHLADARNDRSLPSVSERFRGTVGNNRAAPGHPQVPLR